MEEIKDYETETRKEGVASSEVPAFIGKNVGGDAGAVVLHSAAIVNGKSRRMNASARRPSKANWTEEEDDVLGDAVQKYEGKCWKKIAECLPGRTDVQCLHRWQKVLKPDLIKGPWSKEEDSLLIELVSKFSEKKWSEIAEQLPGRMGKQCRERWYNHLKPEINKAAWTDEEEKILINAHAVYGNKWSVLAKLLPGRTENSVKNHWNCSLKKKLDNHLASGSAIYCPRFTEPPLHGNKKEESLKSFEANQNLSSNSLCREQVDIRRDPSPLHLLLGNSGNSLSYPSSSVKVNHSLRPPDATSCQTKLLCCCTSPFKRCSDTASIMFSSIRPRRHSDVYDNIQLSTSDCSYTGLCYEPIQKADLDIFLSTGRFPSSESYVRRPNRSISLPPPRKESTDLYSRTQSILMHAALSYDKMPSIIRKRATPTLQKCIEPDEEIDSLKRTVPKACNDDQVQVLQENAVFSPKCQKLERLHTIKSVGKCLEREFSDA